MGTTLTRDQLQKELKSIPDTHLGEVYDFIKYLKYKIYQRDDTVQTHYASEDILGKDWYLKEEDEAWQGL